MGDMLVGAAWHIFALTKLRQYGSAADELAALGSLDSPAYLQDGPDGAPFRASQALMMVLGFVMEMRGSRLGYCVIRPHIKGALCLEVARGRGALPFGQGTGCSGAHVWPLGILQATV